MLSRFAIGMRAIRNRTVCSSQLIGRCARLLSTAVTVATSIPTNFCSGVGSQPCLTLMPVRGVSASSRERGGRRPRKPALRRAQRRSHALRRQYSSACLYRSWSCPTYATPVRLRNPRVDLFRTVGSHRSIQAEMWLNDESFELFG